MPVHQALPKAFTQKTSSFNIRVSPSPSKASPSRKDLQKNVTNTHSIYSTEKPKLKSPMKSQIPKENNQLVVSGGSIRPFTIAKISETSRRKQQTERKVSNKTTQYLDSSLNFKEEDLVEQRQELWEGIHVKQLNNGQTFVGCFRAGRVHGHGTLYLIDKVVMGIWKDNQIVEVLMQSPI